MFRDREDHGMFINILALRAYATGARIYSDAEMSNHIHVNVATDAPDRFGAYLRMSYTKYFNRKYGRTGRFGDGGMYILRVSGDGHQRVVNNYIMRNGLHHCATERALDYEWCSIHEPFAPQLGKIDLEQEADYITDRHVIADHLPRHSSYPDHYRMGADGVFLRRSFMDIEALEQLYETPAGFLYQMNRPTDESWIAEQKEDEGESCLIRLGNIEPGYAPEAVAAMLRNESGSYFHPDRLQDLDVCRLIDRRILKPLSLPSVYQLDFEQQASIYRKLHYEFNLPANQVRRCLALR